MKIPLRLPVSFFALPVLFTAAPFLRAEEPLPASKDTVVEVKSTGSLIHLGSLEFSFDITPRGKLAARAMSCSSLKSTTRSQPIAPSPFTTRSSQTKTSVANTPRSAGS